MFCCLSAHRRRINRVQKNNHEKLKFHHQQTYWSSQFSSTMAPVTRRRGKRQTGAEPKTRKKSKYVRINFEEPKVADAVIEDLRRVNSEILPDNKRELEAEILDQICLDGLSGTTFRRLLTLLDAVFPDFKCLKSEQVQDHIWKVVVLGYLSKPDGSMVRAYHSDQAAKRKQRDNFGEDKETNDKSIIVEKAIKLPERTLERLKQKGDIMLYPTQDGRIRGSCESYQERVEVTQDLIDIFQVSSDARESLDKTHAKFGIDNIVFVASQSLRFKALVPNWVDPAMDIKLREYCTLELIGKSRTLGLVFPNDKQFGRYRILLLAKALICQYQETCSTFVIQHLIRFSPGKKVGSFKSIIPKPKVKLLHERPELDEEFDTPDCMIKNICCNPNRLKVDRDFMKMIYDFIALSEKGCTQIDIRRKFRISKFHVRNYLKNMISMEWIHSKTDKSGDKPLRIFRTVHKSHRRKMLLSERIEKPSRGVMASWDDRDLKAKKILGKKRSVYTKAEDSFLVLCRIVTLLLEPTLRKKSYCVNKKVIRDLLHEELIESHDKTSDALRRRIKYLQRLPNNMMSIDEITAELRDDSDVVKIVSAKKALRLGDEAKLNKLFIHLLRTIRAKIPHLDNPGRKRGEKTLKREAIESYRQFRETYNIEECKLLQSKSSEPCLNRLLNRYLTSSLMQLAHHISATKPIDLSESNEISSIALLTSMCTLSSFEFDLELKIPINVVFDRNASANNRANESGNTFKKVHAIDSDIVSDFNATNPVTDGDDDTTRSILSDALIVQPCSVRLSSPNAHLKRPTTSTNDPMGLFLASGSLEVPPLASTLSTSRSVGSSARERKRQVVASGPKRARRAARRDKEDDEAEVAVVAAEKEGEDEGDDRRVDQASNDDGAKVADNGEENEASEVQSATDNNNQVLEPKDYSAPVWKTIEGRVHIETLLKLIEVLLSWIIMFPGLEFDLIQKEFGHSMPKEHLLELLKLMKELELISMSSTTYTSSSTSTSSSRRKSKSTSHSVGLDQVNSGNHADEEEKDINPLTSKPYLFGRKRRSRLSGDSVDALGATTFEPTEGAFIRYSQLLESYLIK